MITFRPSLLVWLLLVCAPSVHAGGLGIATLVEGGPLVLRAATWYKLVPGARMEDGDIIDAGERAQVQIEFAAGSAASLVGAGSLYLAPPSASATAGSLTLSLPRGWLKVVASSPELRVRTTIAEIATTDAILVLRTAGPSLEFFIESGTARLTEFLPNGASATARDVKRGEFGSKPADAPFALQPRAPKTFVEAMPRHFVDPLPRLAAKFKNVPVLAVDHDVTYAEAEPWLASRDRAVFEKRFTSRLRDPAFRKAVEPHVARYPSWDRKLHPEKFAARPKAGSTSSSIQSGTSLPPRGNKEAP
jgi:hypothetical protein